MLCHWLETFGTLEQVINKSYAIDHYQMKMRFLYAISITIKTNDVYNEQDI